MDSPYAQHATAVAREIVRLGLSDQETVRQLYQEYTQYLQQGVQASFTQLLLSRGVIDQPAFLQLQANVPLSGAAVSVSSSGTLVHSAESWTQRAEAAAKPLDPVLPPVAAEQTADFDNILSPGSLEESRLDDSPLMLSDEAGVNPNTPAYEVPASLLNSTPSGSGYTPGGSRTPGGSYAAPSVNPAAYLLGNDTHDSQAAAAGAVAGRDPREDFIMSDSAEAGGQTREPSPGDIIGAYKLLKIIGRGGMGVIYKAQKIGTEEILAVKVLMGGDDKGSDRRRQRFRREVEAMRRLEHEFIVGVYDYGRIGSFDWYAMDFVEGKDFEKVLEDGDLEPAEKMRVYFDICEAMAHAHERSVIHRDLKPQNVIVDKAGRGHVLDFGLAKIMDQGIGMTRTGSALGTPYYMAPEQLRSAKHIDQRADVFSLGVILFEITVGERPFKGETAAEVGTNILNTEPPRPTSIKKTLHPDIDGMVIRALEKDPERRYQSANELLEDLIRHRKGFGVGGAKGVSGAAGSVRRWAERNRAALIGAGAVAAVLVPALIYLAIQNADSPPPPRRRGGDRVATKDPKPPKTEDPKTTDPDVGAKPVKVDPVADPIDTSSSGTSGSTSTDPVSTDPSTGSATGGDPTTGDPKPEVTDVPKPEAARTELEKAVLALTPPEEAGPSGADEAKAGNSTKVAKRQLINRLDGDVFPAMAVGDFSRAATALGEIVRDADIREIRPLTREIENDIETLTRFRKLVGVRLKEDPRLLRRAAMFGGDKLAVSKVEVQEDDMLKLSDRHGWAVVDPCALTVNTLEPVVLLGGRNKKADDTNAHYALALLSLYRAAKGTKNLDQAGTSPATQRRRRTAEWMAEMRTEVKREWISEAENAWRELDKKKDSSLARGLDDFVRDYARTEPYMLRRDEWIKRRVALVPDPSDLLAAKYRKGSLDWTFKGDQVGDFLIGPYKADRPFRAEAQSSSLVMQNGRVEFELNDLESATAMAEVASNDEEVLTVILGEVRQEIDPDAKWVVTYRGRKIAEELKSRKMTKAKKVRFEVGEESRVFRINPKDLEVPKAIFKSRNPKNPVFGAESAAHLRVTEMELAWDADKNGGDAPLLRQRLMGRKLLLQEREENAKPGKGAKLLMRSIPGSLQGFLLVGEWSASRREMSAGGGAVLWASRRAQYGVFEFEYACDDGPGVTFQLGVAPQGDRPGDVRWALPSTLSPEPDTYRKVTCILNLRSKLAVVIVDGMWLTQTGRLPTRAVYPGLRFEGRTTGKVRAVSFQSF